MGYYSEITYFEFKTNLSEQEFHRAKRKFLDEISDEYEKAFVRDYLESLNYDDGIVSYDPEDYYAKHYHIEKLAEFVSKVIVSSDEAYFELRGEDGERWGYRITRGKVQELVEVSRLIPVEEARNYTLAHKSTVLKKFHYDLETGTLDFELEDGRRFETVVLRENGKKVSIVPNQHAE